jgi:GTP cyclohydrolase I
MGLPAEVRGAQDLAETPRRVAEAWLGELVDGYGRDPAEILAGGLPSAGRDLVAVTGIDYHSVCPHHLLPSRGVAHVAYVPGGEVVGFGQLVKLVDALAHRLVLEEDLARDVAEALVRHLGARGAACVLEAEQLCMTVRGEKRAGARAHAEAWVGTLAKDGPERRRFEAVVARLSRVRGRRRGRGGLPSPPAPAGGEGEGGSRKPRGRNGLPSPPAPAGGEGKGEGGTRKPRSRRRSR